MTAITQRICHVCKQPILQGQAHYGASVEPCHWDCRDKATSEKKSGIAIEMYESIQKLDAAFEKLKRNLK